MLLILLDTEGLFKARHETKNQRPPSKPAKQRNTDRMNFPRVIITDLHFISKLVLHNKYQQGFECYIPLINLRN